jgi:hypothetical protein
MKIWQYFIAKISVFRAYQKIGIRLFVVAPGDRNVNENFTVPGKNQT